MRSSLPVLAAALLGLVAPLSLFTGGLVAAGRANRPDVISIGDVHPGMKGYGLTVFEGTRPERFEVEVIDVLKNFQPRQDLILIKTRHPRLEVAKVVAGMSGSPIYLEGKMAGAYAYGWTFGAEPVAGVTPIRNMLDDLERPLPDRINGWPLRLGLPPAAPPGQRGPREQAGRGRSDGAAGAYRGALGRYSLREHARQLAARMPHATLGEGSLRPVATPIMMGGMSPAAVEVARGLLEPMGLEPLQAGGGPAQPEGSAPTRFVDGGAIAVQLVRGDMNASGLGTVTRVEGDKLVAFGHPMMESGVTALPTAVGRVLWFLASQYRSFKLGMPVRSMGTLVNDRQASIVVSQSLQAPVIPVTMQIDGVPGAPDTQWSFEVAHEKFMTPTFMAVALGSAMQSTGADRQDVSWNAESRLKIKGHGEIVLEDFGVAIGGTPDPSELAGSNLVGAVGKLLNNPWEPVLIESASMKIRLRYAREVYRLRGAEVLDPEVEAGHTARVRLTFLPFAGEPVVRVVEVPMPKHLGGQTVQLSVRPGHAVEHERAPAERLADLIANLEDPVYPAKSVVISYTEGAGVAYKGRVVHHLPPGALGSIDRTSATIAPATFKSEVRQVFELPEFMLGQDQVSVEVKRVLR